jgi:hypothetical protein
MRRKKIIAFCRRLLADLQRAKKGTEFSPSLLFILGYFRRRKPLREILTPTEPARKTDPTSTSSLSGFFKLILSISLQHFWFNENYCGNEFQTICNSFAGTTYPHSINAISVLLFIT